MHSPSPKGADAALEDFAQSPQLSHTLWPSVVIDVCETVPDRNEDTSSTYVDMARQSHRHDTMATAAGTAALLPKGCSKQATAIASPAKGQLCSDKNRAVDLTWLVRVDPVYRYQFW